MMNKDLIYHFGKRLLPHPRYWPKKLHEIRLDRYYYQVFNKHIDFKNPISFNEKMQWYMLYYNDPIVSRVTNKVTLKDYVYEKLGEGFTAKLLGTWESVDAIDFDSLTPPYVLKSNCSGNGENIIVIKDDKFDRCDLRERLSSWLQWQNTFANGSSNAYWDIKPMIMAEEYLADIESSIVDYKCYCFNGKMVCLYTSYDGFVNGISRPEESRFAFYDKNFKMLNVHYDGRPIVPVEKPKHFSEMIQIAEELSAGFPFVRVDFYDLPNRLLVGEMTYDSSWGNKRFTPDEFDYELGRKFILPINH